MIKSKLSKRLCSLIIRVLNLKKIFPPKLFARIVFSAIVYKVVSVIGLCVK